MVAISGAERSAARRLHGGCATRQLSVQLSEMIHGKENNRQLSALRWTKRYTTKTAITTTMPRLTWSYCTPAVTTRNTERGISDNDPCDEEPCKCESVPWAQPKGLTHGSGTAAERAPAPPTVTLRPVWIRCVHIVVQKRAAKEC